MSKAIVLASLAFFLVCPVGGYSVEFMPVEDVKAGMKGVGKTVFQGTDVEEFGVEVLGVLRNAVPKSDLILLKLDGGPLAESGIVSGMSGSPVYIDGRLVGALAYALGIFPKEAVAAAVPIEDVIAGVGCGTAGTGPGESGQQGEIVPIATPVVFSGFEPQAVNWLVEHLDGFGFIPVIGGGRAEAPPGPIVPGSVLSVKFVDGDLDMSAVGTLTYVDGERFHAFGHPLLHLGKIELPAGGGYVHAIYKSSMSSNKIVSSTDAFGAVLQDRASGVSGSLGARAEMIPIDISVDCGGTLTEFNVRVMVHELLTPLLAGGAVMNCVSRLGARAGEATLKCEFDVRMEGHDPVSVKYAYSDSFAVRTLANDATGLIESIMNNGFERVTFERVRISLSMIDEKKSSALVDAFVNKTRVKPGESLTVTMKLRPYLGKEYSRKVELKIPDDMRPGEIRIAVADGSSQSLREVTGDPYAMNPRRLEDVLDSLRRVRPPNSIVIKMFRTGKGVSVSGGSMPSVPPSFLSVVGRAQPQRVMQDPDSPFYEQVIETDELVTGLVDLRVEVKGE